MKRLAFNIAILAAFLYLPWYVTALLILGLVALTGAFFDAFLWAITTDVVYGSTVSLWGVPYVFTLSLLILSPLIYAVRKRVAW